MGRRGGAGNREATAPGGETGAVLDRVRLFGQKQKVRKVKLSSCDKKQLAKLKAWGKTQKPQVTFTVKWSDPLERDAVVVAKHRRKTVTIKLRGQWAGNLAARCRGAWKSVK